LVAEAATPERVVFVIKKALDEDESRAGDHAGWLLKARRL